MYVGGSVISSVEFHGNMSLVLFMSGCPLTCRYCHNVELLVQIPEGMVGYIRSRSGMMVNHGITTDGTIDAHYTGSIRVCLFNHSGIEYPVKAGDKIAQLVIVPCLIPRLELVDSLEETDRGDKGFGSTGR